MTISILMSTYARECPQYLDEALHSIWSDQTRKPDQIILVEDGRLTKDLYSVIAKWKQAIGIQMTIVAKEKNEGLALALNDGIEVATGDLIARMDSDDIALPERLLLQENYMKEHGEVDILGGALQEFEDGKAPHVTRQYPLSMLDIRSSMHKASPLAHPTVMFRRRFFDDGFRYNNRFHICEDVSLWFDAVSAGRNINNISNVVLHFRRNPSMLKRRGREKAWSEFQAYCNGIYKLYGALTPKYLYPLARLVFRLMPTAIIRKIYDSKLRHRVVKG